MCNENKYICFMKKIITNIISKDMLLKYILAVVTLCKCDNSELYVSIGDYYKEWFFHAL